MKKIFKSEDQKLFFSDAYKLLFTPFLGVWLMKIKVLEGGPGMNTTIPKVFEP